MARRPAIQFYPSDWKSNRNLRRCSEAARGAWVDIMGTLHDSDEYGICRWPLAELASASGASLKSAKELAAKNVLKGGDKDVPAYVHMPTHAGKDGDPVTLIEACDGPCWYSSRMVRDEWVRGRRGATTQFSSENQPPKVSPNRRVGEGSGDGPSSSSSTSASKEDTPPDVREGVSLPKKLESSEPDIPSHLDRRTPTRWPHDRAVSDDWLQAAGMERARRGLPSLELDALRNQALRFADHYASKVGDGAYSTDWHRKWIGWATDERHTAAPTYAGNGRANAKILNVVG